MKTQPPFTVPQILAMRQWFHKKKMKDLGSPLELSEAYVRDAIKDPEYMETIANLMHTTRSSEKLREWIEIHQHSEQRLTELAERFGVSEEDMLELIKKVKSEIPN